jgi:2,4-dienoyl-CoA reductase (NADPH2)
MGSEGYLINQFLVEHTNHRTDEWGGAYDNRMKVRKRGAYPVV